MPKMTLDKAYFHHGQTYGPGEVDVPESLARALARQAPDTASAMVPFRAVPTASVAAGDGQIDATDAARELAETEGLELRYIVGTGAGGRIIKDDVQRALDEQAGG